MRICVEGYGYCRVSKHFGDDLRVHVAGEQQRGTRVPEVVETDLREPRPLQERSRLQAHLPNPVGILGEGLDLHDKCRWDRRESPHQ